MRDAQDSIYMPSSDSTPTALHLDRPCTSCGSTGKVRRKLEMDRWEHVACGDCHGVGHQLTRAGDAIIDMCARYWEVPRG